MKYSPYTDLNLNTSFYEDEFINYYEHYRKLYNDSNEFKKIVRKANDEQVTKVIDEFLSSDTDIYEAINELRRNIRIIKDLVLISENGNTTKRHIKVIDNRVDKAIKLKNKKLDIKRKDLDRIHSLCKDFISYSKLSVDIILEFKKGINQIIIHCEDVYSFRESINMKKRIDRIVNKTLNTKANQFNVYQGDIFKINELINNYKNKDIVDESSYMEWVNSLKTDYQCIKQKMNIIYPLNIYKKVIKKYDKLIDKLIDEKVSKNKYLYQSDIKKLNELFDNYRKNILNLSNELYNYEYYEYMTDEEKFNIKRELYEDKVRMFKRIIRDFNKIIRDKYSYKYASSYINKVNKKADKFICKLANLIDMPISKNPWFVRKYLWADTENFVSSKGLLFRKIINLPLRKVVKLAMKNKLIIEEMPKLSPNKQYVFVSTHYFTEDVIGLFTGIDRQAHMLMGTTDQIENNPLMTAAMLFGFFHVDRMDPKDRKECFEKQNILIEKGTSFINYIGGSWENSENELQPVSFSGAYRTSKLKDVLIVPVASYLVREEKKIYMRFGEPIDVRNCDENVANDIIRDTLASMHFKQISKYSYLIQTVKLAVDDRTIKTHDLPYNQHIYYMNQIGDEYWNQPWTKPFAKEEIGLRKRKITTEEEVYDFVSQLSREKLIELSSYLSSVMVKMDEKERYNIIKYLDSNYEKFKVRSLKK